MHNLFPPKTPMENLEDAASGEFTSQPKKTLRERPYGNQPLMVAPKYEGDFLDKLRRQQLRGKPVMPLENVVNVYSANSENLLDFSMPSEMLKHQEQPHPRNLVDLYYSINRPGEGVGEKVLDEYHDRSWDSDDAPEMSEDQLIRRGPIPKKVFKVPFHSASKRVVASYLSESLNTPYKKPDVGTVLSSYLGECFSLDLTFDIDNKKVAMLLNGLEETKIDSKTKGLHKPDVSGVTVRAYRNNPKLGRWVFKTHSGERPPAAIEWPYTTVFQFIPHGNEKHVNKLHVRTSCTCPSWLFWGAQYNATMDNYRYGPIRPKFAPPVIRDPNNNFLACKHILACIPWLVGTGTRGQFTDEGFTLHTINVPTDKKKQLMKAPKFQIEKKAPSERLKIPPEFLKIGRKPEVRSIASKWEESVPVARKNMLKGLKDPKEVIYFAHRFPETSTHFVAERLKQIADKAKEVQIKKEAEQGINAVEKIEDKVEEYLPDIPRELAHFEVNDGVQKLIVDLKGASNNQKKRELLGNMNDADPLAYMAISLYREDLLDEVNFILERLDKLVKEKSDEKAKKWLRYIY